MTNNKNKLEKIISFHVKSIEKTFESIIESLNKICNFFNVFERKNYIFKLGDFFYICLKYRSIASNWIITWYNWFAIKLYAVARWTTIPLNKLWIIGYIKNLNKTIGHDFLDEEGVQYVTGPPGCGKSSLMYAKSKDYACISGKASYITTNMEKPKFSREGWYVHNRVFNLEEFFNNGEQIKQFDSKHFNAVILDEMHLLNNNRKNREKKYNEVFLPLINSFVLMRHYNLEHILIASQIYKNDIQLMAILKYYHKVKVKKGFDYYKWLVDGKFKITVLGWNIKTFVPSISDAGTLKLKKIAYWYKLNHDYLDDFETKNMSKVNNHLRIDDVIERSKKKGKR